MTPYVAFRGHVLTCDICSRGGAFCPKGLALGVAFEAENRSLEVLTAECWEPPLDITYPSEAELDADYARWEASQKGKL